MAAKKNYNNKPTNTAVEQPVIADAPVETETPVEEVVEEVKVEPIKTAVVSADLLNFRKSASPSGEIIRTLEKGSVLTVVETKKDWTKVKATDNTVGYVMTQFILVK